MRHLNKGNPWHYVSAIYRATLSKFVRSDKMALQLIDKLPHLFGTPNSIQLMIDSNQYHNYTGEVSDLYLWLKNSGKSSYWPFVRVYDVLDIIHTIQEFRKLIAPHVIQSPEEHRFITKGLTIIDTKPAPESWLGLGWTGNKLTLYLEYANDLPRGIQRVLRELDYRSSEKSKKGFSSVLSALDYLSDQLCREKTNPRIREIEFVPVSLIQPRLETGGRLDVAKYSRMVYKD